MSRFCSAAITVAVTFLFGAEGRAQFVWIDKSEPNEPDVSTLELHQTGGLAEPNHWEYGIDLVHSLGSRGSLVVCQTFSQDDGESFRWQACQVHAQYRVSAARGWRPDVSLRAEYVREFPFTSPNQLEMKLLLSRRKGAVDWTVNPVYGITWGPGTPRQTVGLDGGVGLSLWQQCSLALESSTRFAQAAYGEPAITCSYVGPSITLAAGAITYSIGCGWGLTEESDPAQVQLLVGVGL